MILDLTPGATVTLDHQHYTVEETATFHDEDFRLDLVRIAGATPAHERWLLATLPEPYLMLYAAAGTGLVRPAANFHRA